MLCAHVIPKRVVPTKDFRIEFEIQIDSRWYHVLIKRLENQYKSECWMGLEFIFQNVFTKFHKRYPMMRRRFNTYLLEYSLGDKADRAWITYIDQVLLSSLSHGIALNSDKKPLLSWFIISILTTPLSIYSAKGDIVLITCTSRDAFLMNCSLGCRVECENPKMSDWRRKEME